MLVQIHMVIISSPCSFSSGVHILQKILGMFDISVLFSFLSFYFLFIYFFFIFLCDINGRSVFWWVPYLKMF
jgi:hypothetical protein